MEKVEGAYDVVILKQKIDEIIGYLNSQDQEEICTHDFDLNNRCTKCGVRGVKDMIAELQDTPEEKKKLRERLIELSIARGFVCEAPSGKVKDLQLTFNQKGLLKLISEELDKAREEGYRKGWEEGYEECKQVNKELSKLKQ